MFEQDLHRWLTTVLRNNPEKTDVEDCLSMLGHLSQSEKQAFWQWLNQNDPNLKTWLVKQGQRRRAA